MHYEKYEPKSVDLEYVVIMGSFHFIRCPPHKQCFTTNSFTNGAVSWNGMMNQLGLTDKLSSLPNCFLWPGLGLSLTASFVPFLPPPILPQAPVSGTGSLCSLPSRQSPSLTGPQYFIFTGIQLHLFIKVSSFQEGRSLIASFR